MKEQLEEIEWGKQNERRKIYKAVDTVRKRFQKITNCKASTGRVICEEHKVLERWQEYFKDLLNRKVEDEEMEVELVQEGKRGKEEEVNTDPPTWQGVPHSEDQK